jgi:tRNA(Ile)-lysidine synthase
MLSLGREEIREALRGGGVSWREDSSNRDKAYLRNRIRLELIPQMEAIAPGAVRRICEAARLIRKDNEALQEAARERMEAAAKADLFETDELEKDPEAVQSRALRMWWRANGPELDEHELSSGQTRQLIMLLKSEKGKVNLPGGYHAGRSPGFLHLSGPVRETPAPVKVSGPETRFQGFRLTETPSGGNPGDGKRTQEVPAGFTAGCEIRTRRAGDRIRPFGLNGSRKLSDYLTDRKIPEPFRDRIPLLCRGEEVLWVCGVGAGNIPRWDREQNPVRLTWYGDIPWL